jgi:hypothetical protein
VKAALLWEAWTGKVMDDPARWPPHQGAAGHGAAARPIDEAISTAGGVRFDALDDGLMLKALPGVFCAGEMLDWEAPTGGYLLTACLSTGLRGRAGRCQAPEGRPDGVAHSAASFSGSARSLGQDRFADRRRTEGSAAQVQAAVDLLDGGATVPFIARYRKEATDGLDDIQLRELEARLSYLRELEERRAAVLKSIAEQGKLTPELRPPSRPRPPSRNWKTCTCRSSPSAAPRA